jgi:hypothetical protein
MVSDHVSKSLVHLYDAMGALKAAEHEGDPCERLLIREALNSLHQVRRRLGVIQSKYPMADLVADPTAINDD